MKVAILSQGCAANFGDGEQLARLFETRGVETSFELGGATHVCVNACTVKGESSAIALLNKIRSEVREPKLLMLGCVTGKLENFLSETFKDASVSNLQTLRTNPEFLDEWLGGGTFKHGETEPEARSFVPGSRRVSRHIGIINISDGCLDACTFCSTRFSKGRHRSAPPEQIIDEASRAVSQGCKELWLTGQDTSCYGFDLGTNLARLAQRILTAVKGDYKIRLGMGNPRHLKAYEAELLETYQDDRVYKFIHLPLQSGSDKVLKAMGRRHSARTFLDLGLKFRERFPYFTLSTDMIVGFPGETDEDFKQTCEALTCAKPEICNITRFVPRPGTPAEKFTEQIPGKEKHRRSAELSALYHALALKSNGERIGETETVLTEKPGNRKGSYIAHDEAYRTVALRGNFEPGQTLKVKIVGAETFALLGEVARAESGN